MLLTKLRQKYEVHGLIEIFLSFVYTHTQKMYGKSHWWNVTRLFPSPKRHLLGGATEKRTESEECWDTPSTTKSTWEHVECLVWQIHLAFSVLFSRKKSFFEAKLRREDIQHHLKARKKSFNHDVRFELIGSATRSCNATLDDLSSLQRFVFRYLRRILSTAIVVVSWSNIKVTPIVEM